MLDINATFIFCFISFIIFIFLMKIICYDRIMNIIAEREKFYENNKNTVTLTNSKTEATVKEFNDGISKAKLEGSMLLKSAVDKNEAEKCKIIEEKKQENSKSIQEYKAVLQESSKTAKEALRSEISNYVKGTVSKILKIQKEEVKFDESKIDEILK